MPSNSSDTRPKASWGLKLAALGTLLFLHVPIWVIFLYTLTPDETTYTFPLPGITFQWFGVAWNRPDLWRALTLSLQVASIATVAALILGTLAAAAVYRSNFFGREAISFLLVLPIALPGIVSGIALRTAIGGFGHTILVLDDHHWPRHLLCRCRLQQRLGAFPPHQCFHDRSLHGSGRELLPNVPPCCASQYRHGAPRGRHVGICPFLRRSHRHHLHCGPADYPAHLDLQPVIPSARPPRDKCGRYFCGVDHLHPHFSRAQTYFRFFRN
jgi:hypothetical protein